MADDDEDLVAAVLTCPTARAVRLPPGAKSSSEEKMFQAAGGWPEAARRAGSGPCPGTRSCATAIAVADAEGPDAISMRRIARELHAGAMSLYWHVSSRRSCST